MNHLENYDSIIKAPEPEKPKPDMRYKHEYIREAMENPNMEQKKLFNVLIFIIVVLVAYIINLNNKLVNVLATTRMPNGV
jgi:hypothetical protein